MPPMTTRGSDEEGHVTDQTIAYYMARVRGGIGLITVEMASPEKAGRHRRRELGIYKDEFIPGLTRLVERNPSRRAKASIQLGHGGGHTRIDICGEQPVAPSAIPHPVYETTLETIIPEAMTRERIALTTANYVAAAKRARAGRLRLRRNPRRARLPDLAIPRAVREPPHRRVRRLAGEPRPLRPRRAARGEGRGAVARRDLSAVGRGLFRRRADLRRRPASSRSGRRQAGADALHVTAGHYRSKPTAHRMIPPMADPDAPLLDFAADVKKAIKVPVIAVGAARRSRDRDGRGRKRQGGLHRARPHAGRRSAMGQQAPRRRADPPLPRLQHLHRRHARRRRHLLRRQRRGRPREPCSPNAKPPQGERIAVIGAGPAGLTYASLVADGNTVTVFEKDGRRRRLVPLRRPGADVQRGRRQSGKLRALHPATWWRPATRKRRDVPLRHRRRGASRSCWRRSTASWWRPARAIRSASAPWRWRCSISAPGAGRAVAAS